MDPPSLVQEFFANKSVFITGASGFIGKVIVEKLLRTCGQLDKIYLLIRPKFNLSVTDRLEKLVQSSLFDTLRITHPNFAEKLVPISGDIILPGLGLSEQDAEILKNQVHIVVHSAATIKFNEPLNVALDINFKGTTRLLDLCLSMRQLVSFVHISTAYSNSDLKEIAERIYPMLVDAHKLAHDVQLMNAEQIAQVTGEILQKKPNTYTYTKALVECLLEENKNILPITIIRPSIVTATASEPVKGWIDNLTAVSGVIVCVGKGVLRSILAHPNFHLDLIPVDFLVNSIIVAAWSVTQRSTNEIPVYNCCSKNALTYKQLHEFGINSVDKTPFNDILQYPNFACVSSPIRHKINDKLYHFLPAYCMDSFAAIFGRKQQMLKVYKKVKAACESLQFFTTNEWKFSTENVPILYNSLNTTDQKLFPMCTENIEWQEYIDNYTHGLRKFTLNEDDASIPAAQKAMRKKYWIQQFIHIIFIYIPIILIIIFIVNHFTCSVSDLRYFGI